MNIVAGEGWNELCPFLGQPVPKMSFPKANVTQITWMKIEDVVAVAEAGPGGSPCKPTNENAWPGQLGGPDRLLRGGDSGARQRVSRLAHKTIVEGLKNLTAQIPVLFGNRDYPVFRAVEKWNHVWLVDPLDDGDTINRGRRRLKHGASH